MISEIDIRDMAPEELQRDPWIRRYAEHMIEVGIDVRFSFECAKIAYDEEANGTPEDAADAEMSYWDEPDVA